MQEDSACTAVSLEETWLDIAAFASASGRDGDIGDIVEENSSEAIDTGRLMAVHRAIVSMERLIVEGESYREDIDKEVEVAARADGVGREDRGSSEDVVKDNHMVQAFVGVGSVASLVWAEAQRSVPFGATGEEQVGR